jgi:hypothetical protein
MFPPVFSDRSCPPASGPPPFGHYTTFIIQGSELPGVLFAPVFVGQEWVFLFPHWFETVFSVKKRESIATSPSRLRTFRSRFSVFHMFMLIWSALCPAPQDSHICLQSLIGRPAAQKQSLSLLPLPPTAQQPSYKAGSNGLECQTSSLVTGGLSSRLHYGRASVLFSPFLTLKPQPTILSPTASWSGFTAD